MMNKNMVSAKKLIFLSYEMLANSTKGEKIAFLAQSFYDNPELLCNTMDFEYHDHHMTDQYGYDVTGREFYAAMNNDTGSIIISVGEYHNSEDMSRWKFDPFKNDILTFHTNPDCNEFNYSYETLGHKDVFYLDDELFSSEEGLFQQSTILCDVAFETLEIYLHLRRECSIPFKMNLSLFDLDAAVRVYIDAAQ